MCKNCTHSISGIPHSIIRNPRELTQLEQLERARSRLRIVGAMIEGLNFAKPDQDISRYADILRDVSTYIDKAYAKSDRDRVELHESAMKLMKQEGKLSSLRVALAQTLTYARSMSNQRASAAKNTFKRLEAYVAEELHKSNYDQKETPRNEKTA